MKLSRSQPTLLEKKKMNRNGNVFGGRVRSMPCARVRSKAAAALMWSRQMVLQLTSCRLLKSNETRWPWSIRSISYGLFLRDYVRDI